MTHPLGYTFLGFLINSLVDSGEFVDIEFVHQKIEDKDFFSWLENEYKNRIDLGLYTKAELERMRNFFESHSNYTKDSKMAVSKNGLCLLVAYCLDAAQKKDSDIQ